MGDDKIMEIIERYPSPKRTYIPQRMKNAMKVNLAILSEVAMQERDRREKWIRSIADSGNKLDITFCKDYEGKKKVVDELSESDDGVKYFEILMGIENIESKMQYAENIKIRASIRHGYGDSVSVAGKYSRSGIESFVKDESVKTVIEHLGFDTDSLFNGGLKNIANGTFSKKLENEKKALEAELIKLIKTSENCSKIDEIEKEFEYVESLHITTAKNIERRLKDIEEKAARFNYPLDRLMTPELEKYYKMVDRNKINNL